MASGLNNQTVGTYFQGMIGSSSSNLDNVTIGIAEIDNLNNCILGNCTVSADPTVALEIASKQYIDNNLLNYGMLGFPNTWDSSQTFNNLCIFNATSSFNDLAIFNVAPKSTVNPVAGTNDLARVSYIENNFGIRQESNNWRGIQYFFEGIEVGNASGGNQNIQPNDGTNTFNLLTEMESVINFGAFGDLATWRYNTYLDLYKTQNITASTTLSFPLKTNYTIRTVTTNITITLPAVTSFHHGLRINFYKTSSITQIVTLTPDATNKIIAGNSITELTSDTISLGSGNLSTSLTVSRMPSGGYGWTSTSTDYATQGGNNTFSGNVIVNGNSSFTGNVVTTGNIIITAPLYNSSNQILSSFRECGIIIYKAITGAGNYINFPIYKSTTNMTNITTQPTTSGALTTAQSGTVAGSYGSLNVNDADSYYLVLPNYGLIVYLNAGYTSTIVLNYKNTTTSAVVVTPSTVNLGSSMRVYYNDVEQT